MNSSKISGLEMAGKIYKEHDYIEGIPENPVGNRYGNDLFGWDYNAACYYASFKIGAEWIGDTGMWIAVVPKIDNIDFLKMFMTCFSSGLAPRDFSKIYDIQLDRPSIPAPSLKNVLSPLLIVHFLSLVSRIDRLKHGYVRHEGNLKKVKGHIKIQKNERVNIIPKRYDRVYCEWDEYSADIPENRLIKKALLFSKRFIGDGGNKFDDLRSQLARALALFENVSDEIRVGDVRQVKGNKLFPEYREAVRLAKMILRHFDYSISNTSTANDNVTPFWIDMALLYEHYVYGLLHEAYGKDIEYQPVGVTGERPDFIYHGLKERGDGPASATASDTENSKYGETAILDTKYKPYYIENKIVNADSVREDIRQLSGYARDVKILKKLGFEDLSNNSLIPCIPCVIIYPRDEYGSDEGKMITNPFAGRSLRELWEKEKIEGFVRFYKIGVPLPTIMPHQ